MTREVDRDVVTVKDPAFCITEAPDMGPCYASLETCTAARQGSGAECEQRPAAGCFVMRRVLSGAEETVCRISMKDCEAIRDSMKGDADIQTTGCGVLRVRQ